MRSRLLWLVAGTLLGVGAILWAWKPWAASSVRGRVILAEPMPQWELPEDFAVTLPDAPDVEKRLEPGPTVEVPTLVPRSSKDRTKLERETVIDLDKESIVARKDLPRSPTGGTITAHVPREGGPVELTIVARPESWREWNPQWEAGLVASRELGLESEWGPLGWVAWSPGRIWKIRPVVGGMLGDHICSRGCVVIGGVARFE